MADNILNQDEIDALLSGGLDDSEESPARKPEGGGSSSGGELSEAHLNKLKELFAPGFEASASVLSTITLKNTSISLLSAKSRPVEEIKKIIPGAQIVVFAKQKGIKGDFVILTTEDIAGNIATMMMGEEPHKPDDFSELYISGISEGFNQMIGSISNALSSKLKETTFSCETPEIKHTDFSDFNLPVFEDEKALVLTYRISIEEVIDGEMYQVISFDTANDILSKAGETVAPSAPAQASETKSAQGVDVKPVQFGSFGDQPSAQREVPSNLDLLIDVPMQVTVELGRTRMKIKDILNLGAGSIIELDKLAGEPVDLLVNGKLVAKGEVVVIDENFGVRVTDIVSPMERINDMV